VNYAPSAWAEIISKAAVSPMGIAALVSLIVGLVILVLISPKDKPIIRLTALFLLMLFCSGLFIGAIYIVRPVLLSPIVSKGAADPIPTTPKPTTQPVPAPVPAPVAPASVARTDCGAHWTGWIEVAMVSEVRALKAVAAVMSLDRAIALLACHRGRKLNTNFSAGAHDIQPLVIEEDIRRPMN